MANVFPPPVFPSNSAVKSLPAYQEMMVGGAVECGSNLCGPVAQPTLLDRLVSLGWSRRLAVVASWGTLAHATSARPMPFVNAGLHSGELRPPWGDARKDEDTWSRAMAALDARPRFLWISLNDADEWGHRGSRDSYVAQLKRYDSWLDALVTRLAQMQDYGERTTVVCTTDHGRGDGADWVEHGNIPAARRAFAFALGPGAATLPAHAADHRALRSVLESLLGLAPGAVGSRPSPSTLDAASPR